MPNETIAFTDFTGMRVHIETTELYETLTRNCTKLLGMELRHILDLRCEYLKRGGQMPPTTESIRRAFST